MATPTQQPGREPVAKIFQSHPWIQPWTCKEYFPMIEWKQKVLGQMEKFLGPIWPEDWKLTLENNPQLIQSQLIVKVKEWLP